MGFPVKFPLNQSIDIPLDHVTEKGLARTGRTAEKNHFQTRLGIQWESKHHGCVYIYIYPYDNALMTIPKKNKNMVSYTPCGFSCPKKWLPSEMTDKNQKWVVQFPSPNGLGFRDV